jgi:acyl-CoA synthetase (AMP-forming)/AMP-acid ligase II
MTTSLASLLLEHPLAPDSTLVHHGRRQSTVREVQQAARQFARTLQEAGLQPGQPVAALVTSGAEALAVMFGTWIVGSPFLPLNARLSDGEIRSLVVQIPPAVVVHTNDRDTLANLPYGSLLPDGELAWRIGEPAAAVDTDFPDDAALVLRTSGTTGQPKAVIHTHATMLAALDTVIGSIRDGRGDDSRPRPERLVNLIPVSLALTAGIYNTLFAFRVGVAVVLIEQFSTHDVAEAIHTFAIRSTVLAPAMMSMLAADETITDLSPLRTVRSITAPLIPSEARRFHDRFGVAVLNSYGQTELGGEVVGWTRDDWRQFGAAKLGSIGRPHDGVDVSVRDDDRRTVPAGTSGQIYIRSPFLTSGYADDGALDGRIEDGYLRTGDLGHIDDDGFLWIDGRESDMINRGGLKLMPEEVENVLREHPAVRDVCVAGISDVRLGEVPFAWVVTDDAVRDVELEAWCRARLSPYKIPVGFEHVDDLPRSEIGKVLRNELVASRR